MPVIDRYRRELNAADCEVVVAQVSERLSESELLALVVIGVGDCGKAVVRRAAGFGMHILGNDRAPVAQKFLDSYPVEMVPLDDLLGRADFVTLHTDLNPSSRYLLDDATFSLMKPTA